MAGIIASSTKLMLKNVIRHTNSHNKVVDESEMWQQFDRMKELGGLDPSNPSYGHDDRYDARSSRDGRADYWNSKSARATCLSTGYRYKRAHMDEDTGNRGRKSVDTTSTYWMRQLQKLESSDPNRWDHSGFKEMYPDDFNSGRSDSSSEASSDQHKKKRKSSSKTKKKHKRTSRKHRARERKSAHRHRKRAARHLSSSADSDSDSDSSSSGHSDAQPHGCRHRPKKRHRNRPKRRKHASSGASSPSASDLDSSGDKRLSRKIKVEPKSGHYPGAASESVSFSGQKKAKKRRETSASEHSKHRRKRSKKHRKKRSRESSKQQSNGQERENQVVVEMWQEARGPSVSSKNNDLDKRVHKEIASQCHGLKRKHVKVESD